MKLHDINELVSLFRCGKSTVFQRVVDRLLPPPIKIGARASRWVSFELEAVQQALIAEVGSNEIRALVKDIVAARQTGEVIVFQQWYEARPAGAQTERHVPHTTSPAAQSGLETSRSDKRGAAGTTAERMDPQTSIRQHRAQQRGRK